ncbi:hypothetical protein E2C01_102819 [Portunus trituberculatus]|uniref:Uncharacterized protein n=1 Tax=Portunus trituberculatus TaxID=210409 RepID=A0A5B7KIF6_PORTR|nr:hypothetical protein [Portunus trituberculatus]
MHAGSIPVHGPSVGWAFSLRGKNRFESRPRSECRLGFLTQSKNRFESCPRSKCRLGFLTQGEKMVRILSTVRV